MRYLLAFAALAVPLLAQAGPLNSATEARIDRAVAAVLKQGDSPSAEIALVKDGKIFTRAYGLAQLKPPVRATTKTRYAIASVSKEFVAAAALILQEEGKLSLDDKVSRWFPELTSANEITVRQLLSHTSGYSDFWPQDYVMTPMEKATTPDAIIHDYAGKALDFKPGDDWQYSNTGYTVAGRIIEKVAGMPLFAFLQQRVLRPVGITDAIDCDPQRPRAPDAIGSEHRALGVFRPAHWQGAGWMFAAGQLCVTAEDVAKWDLSILNRTLLKPASYKAQQTPIKLNNGRDSGYSLGLFIGKEGDRPIIHHGGEASGYLTENRIYPNEKLAIAVLTNTMSGSSHADIAGRISYILLPPQGVDARMQALFEGLQHGKVDRAAFTPNFNDYLDATTVRDYASSLGPLGEPTTFRLLRTGDRGGMKLRLYRIVAGGKALTLSIYLTKEDKVEQFLVSAAQP